MAIFFFSLENTLLKNDKCLDAARSKASSVFVVSENYCAQPSRQKPGDGFVESSVPGQPGSLTFARHLPSLKGLKKLGWPNTSALSKKQQTDQTCGFMDLLTFMVNIITSETCQIFQR